jgi:hypothetical protein
MATRPAYVWTGSDWDDIGDKRLGASVTALNTALGSKVAKTGGDTITAATASTVPLTLKGASSQTAALLDVTNNADSVLIRIRNDGNVGIGSTDPGNKLVVQGSVAGGTFTGLRIDNITSNAAGVTSRILMPVFNGASGTIIESVGNSFDGYGTRIFHGQSPATATYTAFGDPERMRVTSGGNVGIGTTSPATRLHVNGTIRYTSRPAAGTITAIGFDANGDLKASSSSLRYKNDVEDYGKGLSEVMQLRPVSFKFNGEDRTNIGFIAEEIDDLGLSEVMLYDEDEQPEGVIYASMVSLLTKAVQELKAELDDVKAELSALQQ